MLNHVKNAKHYSWNVELFEAKFEKMIDESTIEPDYNINIYKPTYAEFKNMKEFIKFCEKDSGFENGICKVGF